MQTPRHDIRLADRTRQGTTVTWQAPDGLGMREYRVTRDGDAVRVQATEGGLQVFDEAVPPRVAGALALQLLDAAGYGIGDHGLPHDLARLYDQVKRRHGGPAR